jgi:D-proline reductase (dithiol) PrdB
MTSVSEPVKYIERIRNQYASLGYKSYTWVTNRDKPPWTPLRKPISGSRLGLVASGGIYAVGQVAFHYKDDASFRAIPSKVPSQDLRVTHFAYDLTDARRDPNVVFPIDTLRNLAAERVIDEIAEHAYTFMGGIYSARRVKEELAPAIRARLQAEKVDVALLVPV